MPASFALLILTALVAIAVIAGLVWRARDGRRRAGVGAVDAAELGAAAGQVSLVQFSTETCARCPQVRRLLTSLRDSTADLSYSEVDLTHRPELAARYRVLSTPTTLLVDRDGQIHSRFVGLPSRTQLDGAVRELLPVQEIR